MRENYSEYRLKIYADKGKLNPRSEGLFTVIERGKNTVCYELKQSNSKERMTLKDIDQITMAFQNQQQLIHHFFHTSNISNIPTVRIYKKRKNYQTDGRKEVELEPLYRSHELALLLDAAMEDGLLLNTRKKSYRQLKQICYETLFRELSYPISFSQYVLENQKKVAISDHFLKLYQQYQKNNGNREIEKELQKYEKEQLNHYSKMRGFLVTYKNYQTDLQLIQKSNTPVQKKVVPEEVSWKDQVLRGDIYVTGISYQAKNDFYNCVNELQRLKEKLVTLKQKHPKSQLYSEILQLEKSIDEIRKEYQIFSDNGLCFLSLLEQYQCIPYFGIGMNPIFPLYRHCICENSKMFDMRGILHIPSDLECMTEEQVLTNQSLIETNIDFRGKEKYPMHIGNTNSPHISYSSIEFLEKMDQILNDKKKKLIK